MRLTEAERIHILIMRGCGDKMRSYEAIANLFNDTFPNRDPISKSTVHRTVSRFERTGSVTDEQRSGRPKTATNDDVSTQVLQNIIENPHNPLSRIAQEYGVDRKSVTKILKTHGYHPYKIRLVQELSEDDYDRRVEFCDEMMRRCDEDNQFFNWICFSDEATFELSGSVNRQNLRNWADVNPHWMRDSHTQHPQKLNVWAGIIGQNIVGPYFIAGNINAENYVHLLRTEVVPRIQEITGLAFEQVWFQQDGAPAHFAVITRDYLNEIFHNKWIGRRGSIEWPPRSPDLTPLDYFYWGYLKSKVFETKPADIDELRARIIDISNLITLEILRNVQESIYIRMAHCQGVNGHQFEHLIH